MAQRVGPDGQYDFVLQDRTPNATVALPMVLAEEEESGTDGRKRWMERRARPIPPKRSEGALTWSHKDPEVDFVFAQDNWANGALQPYYRDDDPARYAQANDVDARWEGVLALGAKRDTPRSGGTIKSRQQGDMFVANGTFESGVTTEWTAGTGSTLAVDTSYMNSGSYGCKVTLASSTGAGTLMYQDLANPTAYRSREITVIAYVRRSAGTDSAIFLRVNDGDNNDASQAVVTADDWTYQSVTFTVDSSASQVRITLAHNATTSAIHTYYVDDIYVIPTGGVESAGKGFAVRSSTSPDEIYAIAGRSVLRWDETDYVWDLVHLNTVTATDIISFNDNIYVAFGESVSGSTPHQYIYGNNLAATPPTWTTAALNATAVHQDNHARLWAKSRNGYGEWALWKAGPSSSGGTERHALQWATDPSAAWNPTTSFVVGDINRYITGLHPFRDSFVVSKVDGTWLWDGMINDFVNITPEWEHSVDEANGAVGTVWSDDLYLASTRQGFHKFDGEHMREFSPILMAPRLADFGGRITAMAASTRELILGLDRPIADTTTTKTSRLAVMNIVNNRVVLHVLSEPDIAIIDNMSLHRDTRLWVFGRTYNSDLSGYVPAIHLYTQPDKVSAPYADVTPSIQYTGWVETSIWHGGVPDTPKAFWALDMWVEDVDETHTVQVDFGVDGRAANYARLGVLHTADRVQTLFFSSLPLPDEQATGRFIQLRFTLTTDDTTSPKIFAFALHSLLAMEPVPVWDVFAYVGDGTLSRAGVSMAETKAEVEDKMFALERQVFPLVLVEDFGQSHSGPEEDGGRIHYVKLRDFQRVPNSANDRGQELYFLQLQEVSVGAVAATNA